MQLALALPAVSAFNRNVFRLWGQENCERKGNKSSTRVVCERLHTALLALLDDHRIDSVQIVLRVVFDLETSCLG
jgi:hypothetical protein